MARKTFHRVLLIEDEEDCPDLILLDINMPGMDGFDFLEGLEALGLKHLIRTVVVLTPSIHPNDQQQLERLGVKSILSKPLTEEKVMGLAIGGTADTNH